MFELSRFIILLQVVSYLVQDFEKLGRRCAIAATGFRSLVSGHDSDFRILVHDEDVYHFISLVPGVIHSATLLHRRGASFRTERYPDFAQEDRQRTAARNLIDRRVKVVVAIGGNGTFAGISKLARFLPKEIQVFFIPVTIDRDIAGSETIGQHTAVEFGAEKIRCYVADAHTHHRCYLIEMMGRDG